RRVKVAVLTAGCIAGTSAVAKELAVVNGDKISAEEFKEAIDQLGPRGEMLKQQPAARTQFLDQLITVRLLEQAARKAKLQDSKAYKDRIAAVERQVLASIYVEQAVDEKSSDKAVKAYFDKHQKDFSEQQVCAQHILLKETDKKKAEEVLKE